MDGTPRHNDRRQQAEQAKAAWLAFPSLGGHHLAFRPTARGKWDLVAKDGRIRASLWVETDRRTRNRSAFRYGITSSGRDYEMHNVPRTVRTVAELELVDMATGKVILRQSGEHFNRSPNGHLWTEDGSTVGFPVSGRGVRNATLSAIDPSTRVLATCRLNPSLWVTWQPLSCPTSLKYMEVCLSSVGLQTPHIVPVAIVAATNLTGFLTRPEGGGA